MKTSSSDEGFTLVELLVVVSLLSILLAGFVTVMLSGVSGSQRTEDVVRVSEEARRGLNRMVRDTREAAYVFSAPATTASPATSFTIHLDFDRDGVPGEAAEGEIETFVYDASADTIVLIAGDAGCSACERAVLMEGVSGVGSPPLPIFDFSSNQLQFDANSDGVATWQEVDRPPPGETGGDANDALGPPELPYISSVTFTMNVTHGDRASSVQVEAQLRNRRGAPSPLPTT